MNLKNKCIVITGGTSGIGYEMLKQLQPENNMIVISRNMNKLNKLSREMNAITTYQANLSRLEEAERVASDIKNDFASIDVLINNAAVQNTPEFLDNDFKYESITDEITLNLTSVCCLIYLLLPLLKHDREAAILNISSGLALSPKKSSAIYCASKGALNIFSQSLRYQLEETNIDVQQALLDMVDTPMTHRQR